MSYDIYLRGKECPTCGREADEPSCPNPTYNLTPIFDLALTGGALPNADTPEAAVVLLRAPTDRPRGLRLLSGRRAGETVADLGTALARLSSADMAGQFLALSPKNGWGTVDGAVTVMRELRRLAESYPDMTWEIR